MRACVRSCAVNLRGGSAGGHGRTMETAQSRPWGVVRRQDDHGHIFDMKTVASREEGEQFLKDLKERQTTPFGEGHKQHYWLAEYQWK